MDRLYAIHRLEKAKELLPEGVPRNVIDDTIIWIKQLPATSNYAAVNQASSSQGDALGEGELVRVSVANGKYTYVLPQVGRAYALRYGEKWRDCCGDNFILALAQRIEELENGVGNKAG